MSRGARLLTSGIEYVGDPIEHVMDADRHVVDLARVEAAFLAAEYFQHFLFGADGVEKLLRERLRYLFVADQR